MDWYLTLDTVTKIWLNIFFWSLLVQLFYVMFVFIRFFRKTKRKIDRTPPVSVVICARNEEDNLRENLSSILLQDYPDFEVIVVNDQSVDGSKPYLAELEAKYEHLKVVEIKERTKGAWSKKIPLSIGIKGASNEILLLTDADCKPVSKNWIKEMMGAGDKEITLGVSPYIKTKGFVNWLARVDNLLVGFNYLGMAMAKLPYMGVGRNLSYNSSDFYRVGGFKKHYSLPSGDDDLFINEVANKSNTQVCLNPDAVVKTAAEESIGKWLRQKRRHYTTAPYYKFINKALLGTFSLSAILLWISFLFLLFEGQDLVVWVASAMSFRTILFWAELMRVGTLMGYKDLRYYPFVIELYHLFVVPLVYYSTLILKPTGWK